MAEKGNRTKERILNTAKELFKNKGYTAVNMSDLCAATRLSRGGLYRYFSSTNEIFTALLTSDKDNWEDEMKKAMKAGTSAIQMIKFFFRQCEQDISENTGRFSLAIYEYERNEQDAHEFLLERYETAVSMMEKLLRYGLKREEFCISEPRMEAEQLTLFLEGLRMASTALTFPAETVSQQLAFQLKRITGTTDGIFDSGCAKAENTFTRR